MSTPALPWVETHIRPYFGTDPEEPVVAMEQDASGSWWHTHGAKAVRPATPAESLLICAPTVWAALAPREGA